MKTKLIQLLIAIKSLLRRVVQFWQGKQLEAEFSKNESPVRDEAEEAVAKVVFETGVAPDSVSAGILRGGCAVFVTHRSAKEAFLHKTYAEAADEAVKWLRLQGDEIQTGKIKTTGATHMNRKERRAFEKRRKASRRVHARNEARNRR